MVLRKISQRWPIWGGAGVERGAGSSLLPAGDGATSALLSTFAGECPRCFDATAGWLLDSQGYRKCRDRKVF